MRNKSNYNYLYTSDKKINNFLYKSVRMIVLIMISLSLLYSFQSETLSLDKLAYKFIPFLFFMLILIFLLLMFTKKKQYQSIILLLKKHKKSLFWAFFVFCILYQMFLFINLKATPSFDANLLSMQINNKKIISEYLSFNSNNRLLFFINYFITRIFGNSLINLQVFNAFLIFTSMLMYLKISKQLFGSSIAYLSTLFLLFMSVIQPLYLVPYTDTYCLLPMFLSINFLINIFDKHSSSTTIIINSILSMFFLTVSYLIRPSCITFIIAAFIFLIMNSEIFKTRKKLFLLFPASFITIFITLFLFNTFVNTQMIVKIDRSKEIPFTHFLLLGSSGNEDDHTALHGTWNSTDIKTTYSGKTKKEKSKLALASFKARTKQRGLSRTIKFYWQKYIQITDTGVVGFHRDGLWINSVYSPEGSFKNKIQQIYYEDGRLRPTFNFICQIIWLFILTACIVALYSNNSWKVSLIALSLFGGLLFLILFESGGTKYLFQYMPLICLLSGVGTYNLSSKILKGSLSTNVGEENLNN